MAIPGKEYPQSYYGILAILTLGPQTGYDIRKELENPEVFYWKESYGNIYPMLRNLERDGLVDRRESHVKKKKKVIYQLNETGLRVLNDWLLEPATLSRFRVEILMKLRFGESAGIGNMISQVRRYRQIAQEELKYIEESLETIDSRAESLSGDLRTIALHYFMLLKESNISWCERALGILEKWERRETLPLEETVESHGDESVFQLPRREPPLIE